MRFVWRRLLGSGGQLQHRLHGVHRADREANEAFGAAAGPEHTNCLLIPMRRGTLPPATVQKSAVPPRALDTPQFFSRRVRSGAKKKCGPSGGWALDTPGDWARGGGYIEQG